MKRQLQQTLINYELILDHTLATCCNCLSLAEGKIIEKEGKIFLEKDCSNCGEKESIVIENDPEFYKKAILPYRINRDFLKVGMKRNIKEVKEALMNESSTVTFTTTFRCNMSCPICFEQSQACKYDKTSDMKVSDIDELLRKNKKKLIGITGGEATLRNDLPDIIRKIIKSGNTPFLATNGLKFLDRGYIRELKKAGLKIVTLQFDGFNRESYIKMRGGDYLDLKLRIIKNLIEENMNIWFYPVIKPGENEDQIPKIIKFAANLNKHIKGIAFCALFTGKNQKDICAVSDVLKIIEATYNIERENYIQSKRFRYNIYQIVRRYFGEKVQNNFRYLIRTPIFLKVKKNKIEPLIKTRDLEKMNQILEKVINNKSKISSIFSLIKGLPYFLNMRLFNLAVISLLNGFNFAAASQYGENNILKIIPGYVNGPANENLGKICTVEDFSNISSKLNKAL